MIVESLLCANDCPLIYSITRNLIQGKNTVDSFETLLRLAGTFCKSYLGKLCKEQMSMVKILNKITFHYLPVCLMQSLSKVLTVCFSHNEAIISDKEENKSTKKTWKQTKSHVLLTVSESLPNTNRGCEKIYSDRISNLRFNYGNTWQSQL